MTSIPMAAKSDVSNMIARHGRLNRITGVLLNVFTISVIITSVLAILKLTGAFAIGWVTVFAPLLVSVGIAVLVLVVAGLVMIAGAVAEGVKRAKR